MFKVDTPTTATPAPRKKTACCTDARCESAQRNNYFEGKRLTAESFRVEQDYLLDRRRLLNRAIHGWGVVYGYTVGHLSGAVRGDTRLVRVEAGLALDSCGRELIETRARALGPDDVIWLDADSRPVTSEEAVAEADRSPGDQGKPQCWMLSVHYAEERVVPVDVDDSCRCNHREWDRVCETVRYSLRHVPCGECCAGSDCELECDCGRGLCCGGALATGREASAPAPRTRGGCGCLCGHLAGLELGAGCGPLCDIEEPCAEVQVDLGHGVPLACLVRGLKEKDGAGLAFAIEACGPRRLVKRNDLLFDLIRGCDLTRISDVGWKPWHRSEKAVPFDLFKAAFGPVTPGIRKQEYVTRDFWVEFSRPVHTETVRADCFAMTVLTGEHRERWWEPLRVPIVGVVTAPTGTGDPPNHTRRATVVVDGRWLEDAVYGSSTLFDDHEARIEIEVRGDFIVDCNGQTVDANAHGHSPIPPGNGTPGDSFLSGLRVAPAHERPVRDVPIRDVPIREFPDTERPKGAAS